jgi:hypothetical protein
MLRAHLIAVSASLYALSLGACGGGPADGVATSEEALARSQSGGVIEGVDFFGEACAGSAAAAVSPDGQAATSTFSDFVASTAPGSAQDDRRRSCLMQLRVRVPAGWSYTLNGAQVRGFVSLEPGVAGHRHSRYVMPGDDRPPSVGNDWPASGIEDSFQADDFGPGKRLAWSPCGKGQRMWIGTEIGVDDSDEADATGQVAIDTIDVELGWKRCR